MTGITWIIAGIMISGMVVRAADIIPFAYRSKICKQTYEDVYPDMQPCMQKGEVAEKIDIVIDKAGMEGETDVPLGGANPLQHMTVSIQWPNGEKEERIYPVAAGDDDYWASEDILNEDRYKRFRDDLIKRNPSITATQIVEVFKTRYPKSWKNLKRGYSTPSGTYSIPRSGPKMPERTGAHCVGPGYNYSGAVMPWSIFYHGGRAMHHTTNSMGVPGSHGCVGLQWEDARELYCLMMQRKRHGGWKYKRPNYHRTKVVVIDGEQIPMSATTTDAIH